MATPLPARPSLDWLRKRAKLSLKQLRLTRPTAKLADAQLALAREHGFSSWRSLKAEIDARTTSPAPPAESPTEELIAEFLQLISTGELPRIRQLLKENPGLINATGPHPHWGGRPQPLHVAIESGRQPVIDLLLRSGADANGSNAEYDHWSPMMIAIGKKRLPAQQALLKRGARIGVVEALMKGDDRTVLRLLKPGPSALPVAPNQGSLLMFARTTKAIDRLLALGVSAEMKDHWGTSPIEAFSRLGAKGRPLVRHLQGRGVSATPAEFARMGDRAALAALAKTRPDTLSDPAVLLGAVDFRHHALVRWLIKQGADPNARSTVQSKQTALHAAAWNGDLPMVKLLVAAGADPEARDQQYDATPLGWAETSIDISKNEKCQDVVDWLSGQLQRGGSPVPPEDVPAKRVEWKPIMEAAFNGDPKTVEKLLKQGTDPNILSNSTQRHRPLHRAIERKKTLPKHRGHDEVVQVLLKYGADPMRRALETRLTALCLAGTDEPRFVPFILPYAKELDLFHAAVILDLPRVNRLLASGVSPKVADINTMTALHYCAASAMFALSPRHEETQQAVMKALVAAGGELNVPHAFGHETVWTISPMYYATGYHDNPGLTELLLDLGAEPDDGESVWHASDEGHEKALEVLARRISPAKLATITTDALPGQLRWGKTRGAAWLLAHGADPNILHKQSGDAALHAVAKVGSSEKIVTLILAHGARKDLKNREGFTAREVAKRAGNTAILKTL